MNDLKLTISSLGFVIAELTKLVTGGDKVALRITVKRWQEKRSKSQNQLYWKWLDEINKQSPLKSDSAKYKGAELWHEVFKKFYCPEKSITDGSVSIGIKSTTLLDVGEMTFYLCKIECWCLEKGIMLTIPESSDYYRFTQQQSE